MQALHSSSKGTDQIDLEQPVTLLSCEVRQREFPAWAIQHADAADVPVTHYL